MLRDGQGPGIDLGEDRNRGRHRRKFARGVVGALAGGSVAWVGIVGIGIGQERSGEAVPNPVMTVDLGFGLAADGDGGELSNTLGLGYSSRTRTQDLELSFGTSVLLDEDGLGDNAFFPRLGVTYGFDNGSTLLSFRGRYSLQEVDGLSFILLEETGEDDDDPDFDTVELVEDDGFLETVSARLGLALWRRDPVGLELGVDLLRRDYRDTSDPDLDDSRRVGADIALRLTPRPGLDFRLTGARSRAEDDGALDSVTETTRFGARVTWAPVPGTTADLSLSHSTREETRNETVLVDDALQLTGGRETVTTDGLVWTGTLAQDRPNGSRALRFSRRLIDSGALDDLELTRALALANGGALTLGLGVALFDGGDTVLESRVSYAQPLPQGAQLTAGLSRQAGSDGDDQDVARTRARVGYDRPLSPVSRLGMSAGLARVEVIDGFSADETAATLSVSYGHSLTPDWSLSAGVNHRASRVDGGDAKHDTRFSLGLGRSFTFRP